MMRALFMDIPDDPLERKKWMMDLLKVYGREFLIFEPEDQPNVFAAPEPEYRDLKSGNLDPRELKSWRYLDFTLKFLQEKYGLFGEGSLVSDCPVHKLNPLKGERPEDFLSSLRPRVRSISNAEGPSDASAATAPQRPIELWTYMISCPCWKERALNMLAV